jgi:glycine oxidase
MELLDAVAGLRPGTPDNLPLVGPGAIDGLVLATGHFRNGILLAPLAAQTVADLLSDDRRSSFAPPTGNNGRTSAEVGR